MTGSEVLVLALVWTTGLGIGALFFAGLWWTVRKSVASKTPALWLFVSMLVRTGTALAGIYLVSDRHWQRMLLCVLGFIIARPIVTWWTRTAGTPRKAAAEEAHRAS